MAYKPQLRQDAPPFPPGRVEHNPAPTFPGAPTEQIPRVGGTPPGSAVTWPAQPTAEGTTVRRTIAAVAPRGPDLSARPVEYPIDSDG
ncbi:hypothetical protein [Candidatus Mycobacterium methanotrophicum]|uniref:Uncharacterized protein n=1 Tax=Candidatus Mycobacterium methanotrophicum TaxID=2943498 RepID=A0ABY4QJY2_9MYCO|nr:hypothetical protein [Candidatus Mycobacterium methanotrophicum]UQX11322.1 hypothetical protein M5I08_01925 [Candidatus Mycobacterium methanotrophicum]